MSSAREILFALARQEFTPVHRARVEAAARQTALDWNAVCDVAAGEGVAPIAGANLATCDAGVPERITERFQRILFENAAFKAERRRRLVDIVDALDARGFEVLLMKSAALEAAGIYHQPWVTSARDVDVILRWRHGRELPPDARAVRAFLHEHGVEWDLGGHHDVSLNGIVELPFDELWTAARVVRLDPASGVPVYVMTPENLLFMLTLNGCRKRYLRLKTLFDIAETLTRHQDFDWARFAECARACESSGVAYAAICAADRTLGLPSHARIGLSKLVGTCRRAVLGTLVTMMRRSTPDRRFPVIALQYAGFSASQRWRSAKFSVLHGPHRIDPAKLADTRLPGE